MSTGFPVSVSCLFGGSTGGSCSVSLRCCARENGLAGGVVDSLRGVVLVCITFLGDLPLELSFLGEEFLDRQK